MARYISKEYLQFMLNKWKSQYEGFEGENKNSKLRRKLILKGYNECETIIEQAPTADVEEVKQIEIIRDDLKWWLETNTEKGVVFIPKFVVENMIAKMRGDT